MAKLEKTRLDDRMPPADGEKHAHDLFVAPPEAPTGTQLRSVVAARKKTAALKVRSVSTGRAASKQSESHPSSRPTRSSSLTRFTISSPQTTSFPTTRSSSAPKKTASASASASSQSHKSPLSLPVNSVTQSSTPSTVRTQSRSSTPSSRAHSRSTIPSVGKTRSAPNSRSSTPISRPQSTCSSAVISNPHSFTGAAESVTSGSSGRRLLGQRSVSGYRASSAGQSFSSHDSPPQTPPRFKATASSPRRFSATITTKGRNNGHASDRKDSPKASSGVSGTASGKASSSDTLGYRRAISKTSLQLAIKHMDIQNGKVGRRPFSSTTIYPQSMRSSSVSEARPGSQQVEDNRDDDGRSLAKVGKEEGYDSARYDPLLLVKDVHDTNWLLSLDEPSSDSDQSLLFDNGFEPPPEPFPPL